MSVHLPFDATEVQVWYWIAGIVAFLLAGVAAPFTLRKLMAEQRQSFVTALHTANSDLRDDLKRLREENRDLRDQVRALSAEVESLRPLRAEMRRLETEMRTQTLLLEGLARDNPHLEPAIRTVVPFHRPLHRNEGDE